MKKSTRIAPSGNTFHVKSESDCGEKFMEIEKIVPRGAAEPKKKRLVIYKTDAPAIRDALTEFCATTQDDK